MLKIHSHACLEIKSNRANLLMDPWLLGSCYWRSWWNYPPLKPQDFSNLNPDIIYITHVHWDHWHGPTLKKFLNKDVLIVTHDEPNKRSYKDLLDFGFKNIKLLKHGESFQYKDLKITPYQFGLFLNDSALVVETPDLKILNANDCKIAGSSLEQIIKRHGQFDFALRSHSSANDRICYNIEDDSDFINDDILHYSRSFKLFMDHVKPKYAVPFASNHCHLHRETTHFNAYINDPYKLQGHLEEMGGLNKSNLKIMLAGDSWDSQHGFNINSANRLYFDEKDKYIEDYIKSNAEKLAKYYKIEESQRLTKRVLRKFEEQINAIPKFLKRDLKNWNIYFELYTLKRSYLLRVVPYSGEISEIDIDNKESVPAKIIMPLIVFNDAVNQNMFHHSAISKRNKYIFSNQSELQKWEKFNEQLGKVELEVYPLRISYFKNFICSYFRRRHEILVYLQAFFFLKRGMKMYDVEEAILESR